MLLGWRDVFECIFEVLGKHGDAVMVFNFVDELTYQARSNLGRTAFTALEKSMIVVARLVRAAMAGWSVATPQPFRPRSATRCWPPRPRWR